MKTADVAVIVPVYNRESLVLQTLASIAEQTLPPRRLVIVDDASTDDSAAVVERWLTTAAPAFESHLIRQTDNSGVAAAVNRGLSMVGDCRYCAVLDSDDCWPGDFIERCVLRMSARPDAVAATCDQAHLFDGSPDTTFFDARGIEPQATIWLFSVPMGIVSSTMMRSDAVAKVGGANSELRCGYDGDLFLGLSLLGAWLHVPGEPALIRRAPVTNHTNSHHLSGKFVDSHRRWARIHERFITRRGGKRAIPREVYVRDLADRWRHAGQQLLEAGYAAEARHCFAKSLAWRPWRMSGWWQLLRTLVPAPTQIPQMDGAGAAAD
jgi:glycosyltransferase involved in cell wall biosynthesis